MKHSCFVIILFLAFSSYSQTKKASTQKEIKEDKIADMIANLPEVIKADASCKRVSHGKRHLVTYVSDVPKDNYGHYMVRVAEDNGTAYYTWYNFEVDAKSLKIYYYDTAEDKEIPLAVWRKQKNYLGIN